MTLQAKECMLPQRKEGRALPNAWPVRVTETSARRTPRHPMPRIALLGLDNASVSCVLTRTCTFQPKGGINKSSRLGRGPTSLIGSTWQETASVDVLRMQC